MVLLGSGVYRKTEAEWFVNTGELLYNFPVFTYGIEKWMGCYRENLFSMEEFACSLKVLY